MPYEGEKNSLITSKLITLNQLLLIMVLVVISYFIYSKIEKHLTEQNESTVFILEPQVNDIYFLDMRLKNENLARKNKYRLAKVVRVGAQGISLVYGRFFYQWQHSVVSSIQYGDLGNPNYFTLIPEHIPLSQVKDMQRNGDIYLVKRPIQNKLYGNVVSL